MNKRIIKINEWAGVKENVIFKNLLRANETDKEVISKRGENSKTFETGKPNQFRLGVKIGAVHYKENYKSKKEEWKDIDTNHKIDKGDYWLYEKMPVKVKVFKNKVGYEIESRRSGHKVLVELDGIPPNKEDVDFEFDIQMDRVRLWKNIKHKNAPKKFKWKITETNKKIGLSSLKFREKPEAFDVNNNPAGVKTKKTPIDNNSYYWEEEFTDEVLELPVKKKGEILKEFLQGDYSKCSLKSEIKYPIKIDTDVNEQVGVNTDDAGHYPCANFNNSNIHLIVGECHNNNVFDIGVRFQTVAVPSSATITTAKLELYRLAPAYCGDDFKSKVRGELGDAATFSTEADYNGRSKTTAGIDWDGHYSSNGFKESPEIKTIIQEIVNGTWSNNDDLALFLINDGTVAGNLVQFDSYDSNTANAAKLFITYTAGGATEKNVTDSGSGADAVSVKCQTAVAETGQGADTAEILASMNLTDTGSGSDTISITQLKSLLETGSGSDIISLIAKLSVTDSGAGSEIISLLGKIVLQETGTGADVASKQDIGDSKQVLDNGTGTEALSVLAQIAITDSGTGAEAITALVGLSVLDSGIGSEVIAILSQILQTDLGSGSEALEILSKIAVSDSGSASEAITVLVQLAISETGSGADTISALIKLSITDSGTGSEIINVLSKIVLQDTGSGADALSIIVKVALTDSGVGAEAISALIELLISDTGSGVDLISVDVGDIISAIKRRGILVTKNEEMVLRTKIKKCIIKSYNSNRTIL